MVNPYDLQESHCGAIETNMVTADSWQDDFPDF